MVNEEHLQRLKEGVQAWNAWRQEHREEAIDLRAADLSGRHLRGVDLGGTHLTECLLSGAGLSMAVFKLTDLYRNFLWTVNLRGADLKWTDLRGADLGGADLREADLFQVNLRGAHLREADLWGADLGGADLREADLRGVNFQQASLIEVNLNGATLTGASLWETQRAGWSIQGIICEAVYWDRAMQEETTYSQGEFERLHADKTKIILHYQGGISPIEIATLPALIQRMEATHPGCALRLHSVQDAPSGATVTLVIDNSDERNPGELETLKADIKAFQIALREERSIRE
jgi:hypothetical protein